MNVVSPGGFPNTLTAEALLEGRSEIRNRVIARVFKELGYIEQWGSGIQRIKSACLAQGLTEPRIREKGDFVDVEFYRPAAAGAVPDSAGIVPDSAGIVPDSAGKVPDTLTAQEKIIIEHIQKQGRITATDTEVALAVKERRARVVLSEMSKKGLIKKRGSARSTFYVLA